MNPESKWRRLIAWLRRSFPPSLPVAVRSRHFARAEHKFAGSTEYTGRRFEIRIERRQSLDQRLDCLLHEWAHVLSWHAADEDDHGPIWGLHYSRIYRAFLSWDWGK